MGCIYCFHGEAVQARRLFSPAASSLVLFQCPEVSRRLYPSGISVVVRNTMYLFLGYAALCAYAGIADEGCPGWRGNGNARARACSTQMQTQEDPESAQCPSDRGESNVSTRVVKDAGRGT